jgi:hypothetical protein
MMHPLVKEALKNLKNDITEAMVESNLMATMTDDEAEDFVDEAFKEFNELIK